MIAGSRQRINKIENDPDIRLGNDNIKRVKETKTLGIIIDDQLKLIRRMKMFVPQATLISVYNAIVQPHFDYCSLVWDIGNAYSLEKLQKMQNRAARVITGKSYEVRSQSILQELGWQPLVDRWKQNKAVFMYKVKNGNCLTNTANMFNVKNNLQYNLRNNECDLIFTSEKAKTNFLKKVLPIQA